MTFEHRVPVRAAGGSSPTRTTAPPGRLAARAQPDLPLLSHALGQRRGHDFGRIAVDQSGPAAPVATPPAPAPAAAAPRVTVDRIDFVQSSSGAIGGYPAVTSGDLNTPGPFNSPTTDGVSNVHQIKFHLDSGTSARLTPRREIQRSAWLAGVEHQNPPTQALPPGVSGPPAPGGFDGVLVGPDGPAAHEVQRPSADTIVIADAPGAARLDTADFPFIYRSHFSITVASGGVEVARARYDVRIEKKNLVDVPNTENRLVVVEKEDLVRGASLP